MAFRKFLLTGWPVLRDAEFMIYLGTDHAGLELKEHIKAFLLEAGQEVKDLGAFDYDLQDDYPDFILPVAEAVAAGDGDVGIVFGGSGQGEALAANKVKGVRAALYYGGPLDIVELSRTHNNANVLSLGARFVSRPEAEMAVELWLKLKFPGEERHLRRLNKIAEYE